MMSRIIFFALLCCILGMQSAVAQEYEVKPGDSLEIMVLERPSLSASAIVDDNGYIGLPHPIGSVKVVGLTANDISKLITERLEEYVKRPTVFVSITPAQGFTVHVLGEVQTPSFYEVPEGTSIQEVITRAGGFTKLADIKHIKLIRREKGSDQKEQKRECIIDFSQFIEKAVLTANPTLQSNDVLVIPRLSKTERSRRTLTVIGAVNNPGTLHLEEPLSLVEVLALAGWPSDEADMQNISILSTSDGKYSWKRVDFTSFLKGETASDNPKILPGQIVFVPKTELEDKRTYPVNVVGQVGQLGVYPVTEGTRLFDAIQMAGGFTDEAAIDRVTIIHSNQHNTAKVEMNLQKYLSTGDLSNNPPLTEGDTIFVPMAKGAKVIPSIHTTFFPSIRVSIIGEVGNPNTYRVSSKASVLDVLKVAGGPTADADLQRVTVIREQTEKEQRLKIDLEQVLTEGKFKSLPPLQEDDTIFVPKPRATPNVWPTIVRLAADVSTIALAYLLITGRR